MFCLCSNENLLVQCSLFVKNIHLKTSICIIITKQFEQITVSLFLGNDQNWNKNAWGEESNSSFRNRKHGKSRSNSKVNVHSTGGIAKKVCTAKCKLHNTLHLEKGLAVMKG